MSKSGIVKPYNGNEPYIFVSFSQADWDIVSGIIAGLSQRGYRVWYDALHSIGNPDLQALADRIRNCEIFLCVLSANYKNAPNCRYELDFALKNNKNVYRVMIEDLPLSQNFQLSLSDTTCLNVSKDKPGKEMTDHICSIADQTLMSCKGEPEQPPAKPTGTGEGSSYKKDAGKPAVKPERKPGFFERLTGRRKNKENKETGKANFSVLSPKAVKPDSYGIIQLHMYTDAERSMIDKAIEETGGVVNETTKNDFAIEKGVSVTARLESGDVEIRDNLETQVWNGKHLLYDFQFYVPEEYQRSQIAFTCYIECNGIPVTRLNFIVAVMKVPDQQALPAKVTQSDYHKAFISYSRKDEQRMLARVLGIKELAPNMVFWLDKQSLDAGELWREEIRKAILISDVLLLFWSVPASKSKEVENEWRYGLEQKGLSFIAPVPLDPPSECPPPESLKPLNFTVRAFSTNEITEQLTFYNSDNIRLI